LNLTTKVRQPAYLYDGSLWVVLAIILLGMLLLVLRVAMNPLSVMTSEVERLSGRELEAFIKLKMLPAPSGQLYRVEHPLVDRLTLPDEFEVLLNGVPVRFEVDTGSQHDVIIPPEIAIAAQIPILKEEEPMATAHGFMETYSGIIPSLTIGEMEIKNVPVHIMGGRAVWKLFGLIPVGRALRPVLGLPFLRHFTAVSFDPRQRTNTFWNRTPELNVTATVPFDVVADQIALEATIQGRGPYKFMFDSGLPSDTIVIVSERLANELGANKKITKITQMVDPKFKFPIKEIRLGEVVLKDIFSVAVGKELPVSVLEQFFDGVIGIGSFKNRKLTIDFQRQKLYLELDHGDGSW
jgi:hypothetical protein